MGILNKERQLTPSWDLVKPSIELVKKYFWQIVYLGFVPSLILYVGLMLMGVVPESHSTAHMAIGGVIAVIGLVWAILAYPGFYYLQLEAVAGHDISVTESFRKGLPHFWPLLGAALLGGILVVLGLIALIVPGLFLIRGFLLAPYYVVDQRLGPVEALKKSYSESVPVSGWIWGIIGVQLVLGIISSILGNLPFIGFLLSLAVGYIYVFAPALRYREVAKNVKVVTESAA